MTPERETFFRCTFSSPRRTSVAHVSAWDAREAVQLFSAELRGEGVGEPGTIEVAPLGGRRTTRAKYDPKLN
jgi:hypothetical protein